MARDGATDLPYIDTHTLSVAADPDQVWQALRGYVDSVGISDRNPVAIMLGTDPPAGFRIASEVPAASVTLEGRHRFSTYRLVFEVEARTLDRTTLLHATSYAAFPGLAGRAYRTAVIGTGLHVLATRLLLRSIARRAKSAG